MNFEKLDAKELANVGIWFKTDDETNAFAEMLSEELEFRIGEDITRQVSEEQLEEYERCIGDEEVQRWLEKNCPDYPTIVAKKREELEKEIIEYKTIISGVLPEPSGE